MTTQQALSHSQTQHLSITPQLQQSLKILQASQEELVVIIDKELLENPLLAAEEEESVEPRSIDEAYDNSIDRLTSAMPHKGDASDGVDCDTNAAVMTLQEQLLAQVSMISLSVRERTIFFTLIHNLGDGGYLVASNVELRRMTGASRDELEKMIGTLQSLEPSGIGARNLEECLLIQLKQLGKSEDLEAQIIRKHAKLLSEGRIDKIAQLEHVSVKSVHSAVRTYRTLNPFPASCCTQETSPDVVPPDVVIIEVQGGYRAVINDTFAKPHIRLQYQDNVGQKGRTPEKRYLKERMRSATWLLQCIQQRQETLLKIAQCIADFEEGFFQDGMDSFRPLYLKDIADRVGLHESTVSRAIANKLIYTPRGLFEMKYFFTSRIDTSMGEVSSLLVKEVIRSMVQKEIHGKPLSDYAIADALKANKVSIARRTVTKYREEMRIPAAPMRKIQATMRTTPL